MSTSRGYSPSSGQRASHPLTQPHRRAYSPRPQMAARRIFSGIQPTGRKHLGNYIGAIRQYVEGQDRGEAIYCTVDRQAITVPQDPADLRDRLYDTTAILLA